MDTASEILVWIVWVGAATALFASGLAVVLVLEPVLQRARADREPGLARRPLPPARRPSSSPPRRCSSTRGPSIVMFLFVIAYLGGRVDAPWAGDTSLQTVASVIAAAAIAVEVIVVIVMLANDGLARLGRDRRRRSGRRASIGAPLPLRPPDRLRGDLDHPPRRRDRRRHPREHGSARAASGGAGTDDRARGSPPT